MNYKVIFSGDCFDCEANFESSVDCTVFAKLMAKDGRLVRVVALGEDITKEFINIVSMEEVLKR